MITPTEKDKIIATLGKQYSATIIPHLTRRQIFNEAGNEFTAPSIRKFVCGLRENLVVEMEILKLADRTEKKIEKEMLHRNKLTK